MVLNGLLNCPRMYWPPPVSWILMCMNPWLLLDTLRLTRNIEIAVKLSQVMREIRRRRIRPEESGQGATRSGILHIWAVSSLGCSQCYTVFISPLKTLHCSALSHTAEIGHHGKYCLGKRLLLLSNVEYANQPASQSAVSCFFHINWSFRLTKV